MDFGFFADADSTRFCFLRLRILKELFEDEQILDALLDRLDAPGKISVLKSLPKPEKQALVVRQIDHFRATTTSVWYQLKQGEVLAAAIYTAEKLPEKLIRLFWSQRGKESDLLAPVMEWLRAKEHTAYDEVPLGTKRADALGYRKGGWVTSEHTIAVELKNTLAQLERGLDQMTTYCEYANVVYLAVTPFLAAEYVDKHGRARGVRHWDAGVLSRKLEAIGVGLLLIEGAEVFEYSEPTSREPSSRKIEELRATLREME